MKGSTKAADKAMKLPLKSFPTKELRVARREHRVKISLLILGIS